MRIIDRKRMIAFLNVLQRRLSFQLPSGIDGIFKPDQTLDYRTIFSKSRINANKKAECVLHLVECRGSLKKGSERDDACKVGWAYNYIRKYDRNLIITCSKPREPLLR